MFETYQPYWIYRRYNTFGDASNKNYLFHKLDYGMNYLLRRILIKAAYNSFNYMPTINIIDTAKSKTKTPKPIPTNLTSTPGNEATIFIEPVGDTFTPYSTAIPPISSKTLNYVFPAGYNLSMEIISPSNLGDQHVTIDVLLVGYYIPEKDIPMFKGAG